MSYEVAGAGALIAVFFAVAAVVWVAGRLGARARKSAALEPAVLTIGPGHATTPAGVDDDPWSGRSGLDEQSQSALAACMFATAPDDHVGWTAMVVDPALRDTPEHIRLVGHYETELAAIDAAAHLADELNECLVPGEAPLTATALGIEPAVTPEPLSHVGRPIAYSGTPLSGHPVTDLDAAPVSHR